MHLELNQGPVTELIIGWEQVRSIGLFTDVLVCAVVSRGESILMVNTARATVATATAMCSAAMLRIHARRIQCCWRTVRPPTNADDVVVHFARKPIRQLLLSRSRRRRRRGGWRSAVVPDAVSGMIGQPAACHSQSLFDSRSAGEHWVEAGRAGVCVERLGVHLVTSMASDNREWRNMKWWPSSNRRHT